MLWVAETIKNHFFKDKTRGSKGWNISREKMWQELQGIISSLQNYKGVFHNRDVFDAQIVLSDFYWIHESLIKLKNGSHFEEDRLQQQQHQQQKQQQQQSLPFYDDQDYYFSDEDDDEEEYDYTLRIEEILTHPKTNPKINRRTPKKHSRF